MARLAIVQQQQGAQALSGPPGGTPYRPDPVLVLPGNVGGSYVGPPRGCVLHGSRSGQAGNTRHQEWLGTARYAQNAPGLGWNITVGEDEIALHFAPNLFGWHARAASRTHLGCEFAQAVEAWDITDAQVRAFCWYWRHEVEAMYPRLNVDMGLPTTFPTHAEVERLGLTGAIDGKSDAFSWGSPRAEDLRDRILARLRDPSWVAA